jgi:NADH dehydrogenase [ubiquinone] 1 alpha subcomplex assembly factor 1
MFILTALLGVLLSTPASQAGSQSWYVVNDSVMGGMSESEVVDLDAGEVLFRGQLSLENNGGFASTRTAGLPEDWRGNSGLMMQVVGDGRTYIATIRTRYRHLRNVYYRQSFDTVAGEPITVNLPFSQFEAYAYGTRIPQAPPLTSLLDRLDSTGVMLADKNAGPFELRIAEVQPYYAAEAAADRTQTMATTALRDLITSAINEGVPLYNSGRAEACANRYEEVIDEMLGLENDRLSEPQRDTLNRALNAANQSPSEEQRAWALRRALDWMLMHPQIPS